MTALSGHCVCGKVRYSAEAEPIFTGICHCRTCQRATGAPFAAVVAVPQPSLTVEGTTKQFDGIADSGNPTHRAFCPECGSSIALTADVMPGIVMLPIGTLDDASWVAPAMEIYCQSAQPWVQLAGERQRFDKMPG
jgi:hypothetical protein